jgi:hypothetical protein
MACTTLTIGMVGIVVMVQMVMGFLINLPMSIAHLAASVELEVIQEI